jgi:hypothetical protein
MYEYFPSLSTNFNDLWARITSAVAEVTPDNLHHMWEEINFRWDICCAILNSMSDTSYKTWYV